MVFRAISWRTSRQAIRRHESFCLVVALLGASITLVGAGLAHRLKAIESAQHAPSVTVSPQKIAGVRGAADFLEIASLG